MQTSVSSGKCRPGGSLMVSFSTMAVKLMPAKMPGLPCFASAPPLGQQRHKPCLLEMPVARQRICQHFIRHHDE